LSSEERAITIFYGPQHPASGHMRIILEVDGDIVVKADPDIGYVHRGIEKLAEYKTYLQVIPLVERQCLPDAAHHNLAYILALEEILGIEPPERAQYLRTLIAEINRIASHLYGMGLHGIAIGSSTAYMWCFGLREYMLLLAEKLTGARITYSYIIPGGVRRDLPQGFSSEVERYLKSFERKMRDLDRLFISNPVTRARLEGVGVLSKNDAIRLGVVGPILRASGISYDVRKARPYAAYQWVDFEVATRKEGDSYARLLVRVKEIQESIRIIRQVLRDLPNGNIFHEKYVKMLPPKIKSYIEDTGRVKFPGIFATLKIPKGEGIGIVEAGRGELIYHLISDGGSKPYRLKISTPSFRNLILFSHLIKGVKVADVPAIYLSLDYFPPEADR